MTHNPNATRSQYMSEAEAILKRAEMRGARVAIVIVMGTPETSGFAMACDPDIIIEMRAALPGLLDDLAKQVRQENRRPVAQETN